MGKSMSTAKNVNQGSIVKATTKAATQTKPNQQIVRNGRTKIFTISTEMLKSILYNDSNLIQISQTDQPVPSPPNLEYLKKANSFDKSFNDRLKQVFVTSVNDVSENHFEKSSKSLLIIKRIVFQNPNLEVSQDVLPKDRTTPYTRTPHTQETNKRKPNTLLIDDIKMILINYRANSEKWTVDYISSRYGISKEIIGLSQLNVFIVKNLKKLTL